MELILWRHADAEDGADDAARKLTSKGVKQSERMARWLEKRLPAEAVMLVSPAVRARETARPLARQQRVEKSVGTGAHPAQVLEAAGWPDGSGTVVVVGHQPTIGQAAALALTGIVEEWRVKKGSIWWIALEEGESAPSVRAVISPDLLT